MGDNYDWRKKMKILNFGSLNIDYTYSLEHIVQPGETITSRSLEVFPGGKGLKQSSPWVTKGLYTATEQSASDRNR